MLPQTRALFDKYDEIAADLEQVTGIYERRDILLATDLVYHSVLRFSFAGKELEKGWLETLIIGDTRTGKTATVKNILNYYQLGEFGSGESASFAGLVGGLQQNAKRWNLQWGKIPLNDRRLFVIDEVSGLSIDDIAQLSDIRSSGIAQITKIQMEKTRARTRLIWISNPRHPSPLSNYTYGVLAVKELIGRPEDISRFDMIVTSASEDVAKGIYNKAVKEGKKLKYTSDLCRKLILWAWSRTTSQILIGKKTTDLILDMANAQGKKYSPVIPVVEPAEQRIKLARMAVAVAARFFSCDSTGEKIVVYPWHAEFAYLFLEKLYNKDSFRYDEWSRKQLLRMTLKDVEKVRLIMKDDYVDFFMDSEIFSLSDIEDCTGTRDLAKRLVKVLLFNRALEKTNFYKKNPAFIKFLRQVKRGEIKLDNNIQPNFYDNEDMPF